MQYKVPQGIDMQDRILGPLNLLQFGIILFGGLLAYFIFVRAPQPLNIYLSIVVAAISVTFIFEHVRRMIVAAFNFITKPRIRVWHKVTSSLPESKIRAPKQTKNQKLKVKARNLKHRDISELASILDKRGKI